MAETHIEWATHVWNPVTGCDRVSPGCDHCYALTMAARLKAMGQAKYQRDGAPRTSGPGFGLTCHEGEIEAPLRWKKPRLVFVNSMSDLFHPEVPEDFIWRVFSVMSEVDRHRFQVLTKRPQRMAEIITRWTEYARGQGPPGNIWLGTSIENNRYAFRADHLRDTPAAIRFLSLEPLLGPLPWLDLTLIDWVIVGGESGGGARPLDVGWIRDIRDRCQDAKVPVFVKQLGSVWSHEHGSFKDLKGGNWDHWPEDLRIREMP